jgi:hypothetical protein
MGGVRGDGHQEGKGGEDNYDDDEDDKFNYREDVTAQRRRKRLGKRRGGQGEGGALRAEEGGMLCQ